MGAYFDAMRRYLVFRGRSTRSQYWLFTLVVLVLSIIAVVVDSRLGVTTGRGVGVITAVVALVHLLPSWAVTVRRLHDIDRSGWWVLISIVPLVGIIVMLVFLCTASKPGPNRYEIGAAGAPHVAPQSSGSASANADTLAQLERLSGLLASGAIDQTEFERMKAELLNRAARQV